MFPSGELLSKVLDETRVTLDYEVSVDKTELHYGHKDIEEDGFISIYELQHKMKEWADVDIYSGPSKSGLHQAWYSPSGSSFQNRYFKDNTEFEAVVKLCEHLLQEWSENASQH